MKKFVIATVALAAVALAAWPSQASAAWAYRTVTRYDPHCGHLVPVTERYWIPDCPHAQPYPYGYGYGSGYGSGYGFDRSGIRFGYSGGGYGPSPYRSEFGLSISRSPWR